MLLRAAQRTVVRSASAHAALTLACLFAGGCAAPMLECDDAFTQARIDNPDGDNSWNPSDDNGNGIVDTTEIFSPEVDFGAMAASASFNLAALPPTLRIVSFQSSRTFFSGIADGISGSSWQSFFFVVDLEGNIIGNGFDFDDLHTFNIRFDDAQQSSMARMRGIQLARGLRFTNYRKDQKPPEVEHKFEVTAGGRYFRLQDNFDFNGTGDLFGRTWQATNMNNTSVGPQCTAQWRSSGEKWSFESAGSLVAGYHDVQGMQVGAVGEDLVPGGLNRPANAQPHGVYAEQSDNQISPLGEFDTSASYQLTKALSCRIGYNVFYAGNLRYAEDSVNWNLPDMGLVDAPGRDTFQKTVYASVELLR